MANRVIDSNREYPAASWDGGMEVSYNRWDNEENREIFFSIYEKGQVDTRCLALSEGHALELLNHLNCLLGYPLSAAPFAG